MRLSKRLGVPQHKIRYALRVLEQEGLIRPSRAGAVATKKAKRFHEELREILNEMKETVETPKTSYDVQVPILSRARGQGGRGRLRNALLTSDQEPLEGVGQKVQSLMCRRNLQPAYK